MRRDSDLPRVLAEAIAARGVTLASLRARLTDRGNPVSLATLSHWRSGLRRPEGATSLAALADLEELLALDTGALTSLVGPSRRLGPQPPRARVAEVVTDAAALVERALDELGLAGPPELSDEAVHVVVEVDDQGLVTTVTTGGVWRALVAGARRLPLICLNEGPVTTPPEITSTGGRLGLDRSQPELGLVAHEFVLDRPLSLGEEALVEQCTVFREDVADTVYEHYFTKRLADFTLSVRFNPRRTPARAEAWTVVDDVRTTSELDLEDTTSASLILHRFGPGRAGIRWTWAEPAGGAAPGAGGAS